MTMLAYASKKQGFIAVLALALVWLSALILSKGSNFFHQNSPNAKIGDELIDVPNETLDNVGLLASNPLRPLILYAYKESENARENIKFFLSQGLHGAADFIFILNGETDIAELIPEAENIRIIRRPNTCFDLGAFGEVLRGDNLWKNYKRFITMNASLRGPFLPYWSNRCWSDAYLERLTEDVKLVGMAVNCAPQAHVQSMIWATDDVGMDILLDPPASASTPDAWGTVNDTVAFGGCYTEFNKAIHAEIGATAAIRNAGYAISAMMSAFQGMEYIEQCDKHPVDLLFNGNYFGTNIHPYETMFIKANRNIDPVTLDLLTSLHLSKGEGRSWELCR
ncbi:hypothetical protein F5X99DRAFT_368890 [Biscogniauxia marginata]|nr:hypothetical protein F5X99DRAFT_368890 [Biscogniauxia marginata]